MAFSSISFIFGFFPLFLLVYYVLPYKSRNLWLFIGSVLFYAIGSFKKPEHTVLFIVSLLFNFFVGHMIENWHGRLWIIIGVGINILYLACFKYIFQTFPIGISFYTFQSVSYLCDIYKRKCHAERSLINFGTYLSMFPQLIAGPIVQYPSVKRQLRQRKYHLHNFTEGIRIFILGLGSKILLADNVGILWKQLSVIGYESISVPLAWLGIFAYAFQIYFDFWGYSLMAVGIGKTLGFELPHNFNYPYLSVSMTEFWRRWHITLGDWFREYVYVPLGGNRQGMAKTYRNLLFVWLLTGIWHGAGLNFVLWGLLLFILIAVEKAGLKQILDRYRVLGHCYMAAVIPLSWTLFVHNDIEKLGSFLKTLFGIGNHDAVFKGDYIKYGREYGLCLFLCVLFSTKIPQKVWRKVKYTYMGQIILAFMFAGAVYFLYKRANSPFLYYQF